MMSDSVTETASSVLWESCEIEGRGAIHTKPAHQVTDISLGKKNELLIQYFERNTFFEHFLEYRLYYL